jgi:hypothetical protein
MRRWILGIALAGCFLVAGFATSSALTAGNAKIDWSCSPDSSQPCDRDVCGVVTEEFATEVLGQDMRLLGADANGCGFEAKSWWLGVVATAYDPEAQGREFTGPTLPEVSAPHSAFTTNDRSGRWFVKEAIVANDIFYVVTLRNLERGSDTYPGIEGTETRPAAVKASTNLLNAIANAK